MSGKTGIEWCDATWNPIVGCTIVSPGCTNCYAMKMAARIENIDAKHHLRRFAESSFLDAEHSEGRSPARTALLDPTTHYAGTTRDVNGKPVWTGKVAQSSDRALLAPLRRHKPTVYFVNSMGDLFHESVPDEWIDRVFAVMALAPHHTFIVLTKRAKRMWEYCTSYLQYRVGAAAVLIANQAAAFGIFKARAQAMSAGAEFTAAPFMRWPLSNVVLGVSAEDQQRADERREDLGWLADRGWRTFVSCEPALGPVNWRGWEFLNGVIVGGESGPGARPMHPDWARSIRDQCAAASVPFFFKQWGEWAPKRECAHFWPSGDFGLKFDVCHFPSAEGGGRNDVHRVGKRRAGRLLDGREHNDLPW